MPARRRTQRQLRDNRATPPSPTACCQRPSPSPAAGDPGPRTPPLVRCSRLASAAPPTRPVHCVTGRHPSVALRPPCCPPQTPPVRPPLVPPTFDEVEPAGVAWLPSPGCVA